MAKSSFNHKSLGFDKGRQLICDRREKTLIAVLNHLKSAPVTDWCAVHAKYSRIQLLFQDYSTGKGANSKYANVNLTAPEVKEIFHVVSQIYPLTPKFPYKTRYFKEFEGKYSELIVERNPGMRIQWCLTCTNGDCDKDKKPIKGSETKILQRYTDSQMYQFWSTVNSFVVNWESVTQTALQRMGAPLTKKALEEAEAQRGAGNGNGQQPNNRYAAQTPAGERQSSSPPPPPSIIEDNVPFDEMPGYGTGYHN